MPKLKVCYLVSTTEGGTWALEQLQGLRDTYDCEVAAVLSGAEGTLVDRFKAASIPVYSANFDFVKASEVFSLPSKILKLACFLRKHRFDIIQTHLFNAMIIGRVSAWLADVPLRFAMIAGPFHLEAATPSWVDKATAWMDTMLFPSCEYSKQLYCKMGIPAKKLSVVYYGPNEERFNPYVTSPAGLRKEFNWPDDTPLIGMVAYFYPKLGTNRWTPNFLHEKTIKGHEDLIRAAVIVLKEFPQAKFILVGEGWEAPGEELKKSMQALVRDLNLEKSILFLGYRENIPQIYKDLNIAVQPSLTENLGGSVESLLMEVPTVVTRIGGLVDTVLHKETGIQVNVSDPADLASGILSLLRAPDEAKKLGKAGRLRMLQSFTLKTTVKDLFEIYSRCIQKSSRGYRLFVSLYRFIIISTFGSFIALRFFLLDIWLFPRWDVGWRPWHSWKMWLYRAYGLICRGIAKLKKCIKLYDV